MYIDLLKLQAYKLFENSDADLSWLLFNPFPNDKLLESSNPEEFADENFRFAENCRKLSKRVENTVEKGEIARYVNFFPIASSKVFYCRHLKTRACLGKGNWLTVSQSSLGFYVSAVQVF